MANGSTKKALKRALFGVMGAETLALLVAIVLQLAKRGTGAIVGPNSHDAFLSTSMWSLAGTVAFLMLGAAIKITFNPHWPGLKKGFAKVAKGVSRAPFCYVEVLLDDPHDPTS